MIKFTKDNFVFKLNRGLAYVNSLYQQSDFEERNEEYDVALDHRKEADVVSLVLSDFAQLINATIEGNDGDLYIAYKKK